MSPQPGPLADALSDLIDQAVERALLAAPLPRCDCQPPADEGERLLSAAEVRERLGAVSERYLDEHRVALRLTPITLPGGRLVRYRLAELDDAIRRLAGVRVSPAQDEHSNVRPIGSRKGGRLARRTG